MKKIKYVPYNFNEKYEYKTYINIGIRYKNYFLGKRQKENCNKYKDFDNYTSWKTYFVDTYLKTCSSDSNCNFAHYLNSKLRQYNKKLEIIKIVAYPLYILEVTAIVTILVSNEKNVEPLISSLFIIIIFLVIWGIFVIHKYTSYQNFYKDCVEIIDPNFKLH